MFNFSAGRARLNPAGGGAPVELGVVQSASVELKVDMKELRGAYRYPIAVADGKGTASGKVTFSQIWPDTIAAILGGTKTTGALQAVIGEALTIGVGGTAVLANGATLSALSEIVTVIVAGSPLFYSRAAAGDEVSATTAGQGNGAYSIDDTTGTLKFATVDAGLPIQVTYEHRPATDIDSNTVALLQVGMNSAPTFQMTLLGTGAKNIYTNQPQQFIVQLNACLAPSLKIDFKMDDYTGLDLDYQAFIDVNGTLGNIYMVNPA